MLYTSGTTGQSQGRGDRPSRASAISSASPPNPTALSPATASTRACRSPSTSRSRKVGPAGRRGDARPQHLRDEPLRRGACRFPRSPAVTGFACVPTLLASIDRELPKLRVFLIGGEACPPALVKRWSRPGRTLLNSYGPTETTVTATLGVLSPEKPVTIGKPLPTYSIVILDPEEDVAVAFGRAGRDRDRRRRRRRGLPQPSAS